MIGLAPATVAAQWYPPLMIESHAAYSCELSYLFDITVDRPVSISSYTDRWGETHYGPLCWGSPGAYYDVIRITVWPDEDTRDSGGWRHVVLQTKCNNLSVTKYLEYQLPGGGVNRYMVGRTDEGAVQVGNPGGRILIIPLGGTLTDQGYNDADIVYTIETLDVHNMGNYKDIVVSDSASGASQPDPRCVKIEVPVKENTWGAVKEMYR
jgi:hypothetical protein